MGRKCLRCGRSSPPFPKAREVCHAIRCGIRMVGHTLRPMPVARWARARGLGLTTGLASPRVDPDMRKPRRCDVRASASSSLVDCLKFLNVSHEFRPRLVPLLASSAVLVELFEPLPLKSPTAVLYRQ